MEEYDDTGDKYMSQENCSLYSARMRTHVGEQLLPINEKTECEIWRHQISEVRMCDALISLMVPSMHVGGSGSIERQVRQ